jgi:adenylate kinase family enzyme
LKRVMIIGSSGSGKTTVALKMAEKLSLPLIHLDYHFWKANWEVPSDDEWRNKLQNLVQEDKWIMDGNFTSSLDIRLNRADTIVFVDLPRFIRIFRVIKRWYNNRNSNRPDLPQGCKEQIDMKLLKSVWNFGKKRKPEIINTLEQHKGDKNIFILKSSNDIERFIKNLQSDGTLTN